MVCVSRACSLGFFGERKDEGGVGSKRDENEHCMVPSAKEKKDGASSVGAWVRRTRGRGILTDPTVGR